jgi:serine/threonine-protein kinase
MDFGIAHVFDAETMTQTGSLLGSPAHMAPETIEGEQVDARADLFALGTVLYWLTTGALPFDGKNAPQVLKRVLEGIYKAPEALDARVGADFGRVIATCMSFDPDDRYPDARTARAAMSDFAHELGVLDPDDLSGFLLAPGDQLGPLQEAIADGLIARAERAIERRDIPAACRHLNRALGYDPSNTRVLALLEQMRKGSSRRTLLAAAAAVAAVAATGAYLYLRPPAPAPERPEAVAALPPGLATSLSAASDAVLGSITTSTAAAAGVREKTIADTRALAAATAKDGASLARAIADALSEPSVVSVVSPRPFKRTSDNTAAEFAAARLTRDDPEVDPTLGVTDPPPAPETFTYKFDVTPYFATVYIDGKEKEGLMAKSAGFALTRGTHRVRVTCKDNLCEPYSGLISVDGEQAQAKDIRLKWRSGKINLKMNTAGVAILTRSTGGSPQSRVLKAPGKAETFEVDFGVASNTASIPKVTYTVQLMGRDANQTLQTENKIVRDVTVEPGSTKVVTARF